MLRHPNFIYKVRDIIYIVMHMTDEYKVTQAEFSDMTVNQFIDERFLGLLNKAFPKVSTINITISVGAERRDMIQIFHPTPKSKDDAIVTVDTGNPDAFTKMVEILEQYRKE